MSKNGIIVLENQDSFLYDIQYDSINNLLYTTGRAKGVNLNPLGEESIPNYKIKVTSLLPTMIKVFFSFFIYFYKLL